MANSVVGAMSYVMIIIKCKLISNKINYVKRRSIKKIKLIKSTNLRIYHYERFPGNTP